MTDNSESNSAKIQTSSMYGEFANSDQLIPPDCEMGHNAVTASPNGWDKIEGGDETESEEDKTVEDLAQASYFCQ